MKGMQIDITTGDIMIDSAGLVIANSDSFIAEIVLTACRGDFKEYPLLGAEAHLMRAGSPDPFWPGNAKKMLRSCGLEVINLTISPEGVVTIT